MILIADMFSDYHISRESGFEIVQKVWRNISEDISDAAEAQFVHSFIKGYDNRPSVRTSNPTGTKADKIIDALIKARITKLSDVEIEKIKFGHRLSMGAENIIGSILEEYIHVNVINLGWSCCWGSCIRAVDFCSVNGDLLQVKNKSNTENSSSNKIRNGTDIKKHNEESQKESYTPCNTIGIANAKKYSEFLYSGYK